MKSATFLILILSCSTLFANDVKLGPCHKMGIVIHTTDKYSLVLTTKHGGTEKQYIKFEHPTLDATILVTKPLNKCDVSYENLNFSKKYYHWNEHGYIIRDWEVILPTLTVLTSHPSWPGHSGSGLYDDKGRLVGMCIQYERLKDTDKRGRCISLKMIHLKEFIEATIKQVNKDYEK